MRDVLLSTVGRLIWCIRENFGPWLLMVGKRKLNLREVPR